MTIQPLPQPLPSSGWQQALHQFLHRIESEDARLADLRRDRKRFYGEVALPAFEQIKTVLERHGRTVETGEDDERAYLIVRKTRRETEFQYAIAIEVAVEGLMPQIHCWYDGGHDGASGAKADDDGADDDPKPDEGSEGEDQSAKGKPSRVKTVDPWDGWGGDLRAITPDAIAGDFARRYETAVEITRRALHRQEPT